MSGYTPTTEEVRDSYDYQFTLGMSDISRIAEFDRWLASVKAEAWEEGFNAGEGEAYEHEARLQWSMPHDCTVNPYREETE